MREFENHVLDTQAHETLPAAVEVSDRSLSELCQRVELSPSHNVNQDLAAIWLDRLSWVWMTAQPIFRK